MLDSMIHDLKSPCPITPKDLIRSGGLEWEFIRSSGPGGQNVNKVSSAVRLRFNAAASSLLPGDVRQRLTRLAGKRMTEGGVLIIEARRFRTQERNREDAIIRLATLISKAWDKPRLRRATKPTSGSQQRRVTEKKKRGKIKQERGRVEDQE